jgi:hypothetical protein
MATVASTLINTVRRRVRDENSTVYTDAHMLDLFTRCEVYVNAARGSILDTATLTVTANQAIYNVPTALTTISKVTNVRVDGTRIDYVPWRTLKHYSRHWNNDAAETPDVWSLIGWTLLVLYPAPNNTNHTISVIGHKITTTLTATTDTLEVPEKDEEVVQDLVTAILLNRQRDLDTAQFWLRSGLKKLGLSSVLLQNEVREHQV